MHTLCTIQHLWKEYTYYVQAVYCLNNCKKANSYFHILCAFPSLYGDKFLPLNMHSLMHLPKCVEDLGPLWVYSCFPFENVNGHLMELFHGTQNVEQQILNSVNVFSKHARYDYKY
jgi:hypothetical protein